MTGQQTQDRPNPLRRRSLRTVLLVAVLVAVGAVAGIVWQVYPHAQAVYAALKDLRVLAGEVHGWPRPEQVERLQANVRVLDEEGAYFLRLVRPLFPVLRRLSRIPRAGPALAALPDLAEGGYAALHGGRLLLEALAPALPAERPARVLDAIPPILAQVRREDARLARASASFQQAATRLARVEPGVFPAALIAPLHRLREGAMLAPVGTDLLRLSPALLGSDTPRVWLVVAQNNEELRPTGGFISAVGEVRLHRGRILTLSIADSYDFATPGVIYPPAPPGMRRYLKAEYILLRDANWWPDGPTSARMIARFYALETGTQVDGVILFDLDALDLLVDGIGGLTLPDGTRLTAENLRTFFYRAWTGPEGVPDIENWDAYGAWFEQRKAFMRDIVQAALRRVLAEPERIPPRRLLARLDQALRERHLLIVPFTDARARSLVARWGWDGALRPGEGDYLRVTDTNVGFNKVNAKVRLSIGYHVDLRDPNRPQATLILTYTHTSPVTDVPCVHEARYGKTYEDMHHRCYWNFLRVNVPRDARLVKATGLLPESVRVAAGDAGTREFAGLFILPTAQERTVTLTYTLPPTVVREGIYRLRVQRQPGTGAWPFTLDVQTSRATYTSLQALFTDLDIRVDLSTGRIQVRPTYPLPEEPTRP